MPCYNAEKFIQRSIDSVLSQSISQFEFVIVDDGSTDNTVSIIKSYKDSRIRLIKIPFNHGIANALNTGLKACKNKYIARMDVDDVCIKDRFEKQSNFLDKNKDVVAVGSSVINFDQAGNEVQISYPKTHEEILLNLLLYERTLCHPSVMFRKSVVVNGAKYNEKRTWCEDLDFWFQLSKIGRLANIEKPLLKYCRSNLQSSIKHNKLMLKNTKKLLNMIWQEYKVEKINLVLNYLLSEPKINNKQIQLINSLIKRSLLNYSHFTNEHIDEILAFKRLRYNYKNKKKIINIFLSLAAYIKTIKKDHFKKITFIWKLQKIKKIKLNHV